MTAETETSSVEIPSVGTYRIDPGRSTLSYSGRHMFGLGVVHATFAIDSGELRVADPLTASTVTVTVDAGSFRSNSAKRDSDVRGPGLLDVAAYPTITFVSDGLRPDGDRGWVLTGSVTAHGTSVPVAIAIDRSTPEAVGFRVQGRADRLDRYAFGVTGSKGMVGRYLDLQLELVAVPV